MLFLLLIVFTFIIFYFEENINEFNNKKDQYDH